MTATMHEPSTAGPAREGIADRLLVPAFWGAVSIVAMWLAVLFDGIFGGDMVFSNPSSAPDHHPVGGGRRAVRLHRDDGRGQARLHPPGS